MAWCLYEGGGLALRWLGVGRGGGGCACGCIFRRHLPDVYSCRVSRNASVIVARRSLADSCLPRPALFKLLGFGDIEEVRYRNARLSD